jgi:hypothetical protein
VTGEVAYIHVYIYIYIHKNKIKWGLITHVATTCKPVQKLNN